MSNYERNDERSEDKWNWTDDNRFAWAETYDPRVLAVIERDHEAYEPDGDAMAPAYWVGEHAPVRAGGVYHDNASAMIANTWFAVSYYATNYKRYTRGPSAQLMEHRNRINQDPEGFAARYLRIFHDTALILMRGNNGNLLILDTPTFREHVGIASGPWVSHITGDALEWGAYLGGETFGVGYAVNEARVLDDTPIDFADFDIDIQCWGFHGEENAKKEALMMNYGYPELDTLLDFPKEEQNER